MTINSSKFGLTANTNKSQGVLLSKFLHKNEQSTLSAGHSKDSVLYMNCCQ